MKSDGRTEIRFHFCDLQDLLAVPARELFLTAYLDFPFKVYKNLLKLLLLLLLLFRMRYLRSNIYDFFLNTMIGIFDPLLIISKHDHRSLADLIMGTQVVYK